MNKNILIGQLANIFGVSKQTLIHYDRIGLLTPSKTKENGYRYYSHEDVEKLDLILNLKEAGLNLKQIRNYLIEPSLEKSIGVLEDQNELLEKHIQKLIITKKKINTKIKELKHASHVLIDNSIRIEHKAQRFILAISTEGPPNDFFSISKAIMDLNKHLEINANYSQYAHIVESVMLPKEKLLNELYDHFSHVFIFIESYKHGEKEAILPACEYLCLNHHGLYENTKYSYAKLRDYIKANKLEVIGNAIEIPLITAWSAKGEKDYVTEIQIPIKRKFYDKK